MTTFNVSPVWFWCLAWITAAAVFWTGFFVAAELGAKK